MSTTERAHLGISRIFGVQDTERGDVEAVRIEMKSDGDVVLMQDGREIVLTVAMVYAMVWELK